MSPVPSAMSAGTHLSKSPAQGTGWIALWAQGGEGWMCVYILTAAPRQANAPSGLCVCFSLALRAGRIPYQRHEFSPTPL